MAHARNVRLEVGGGCFAVPDHFDEDEPGTTAWYVLHKNEADPRGQALLTVRSQDVAGKELAPWHAQIR